VLTSQQAFPQVFDDVTSMAASVMFYSIKQTGSRVKRLALTLEGALSDDSVALFHKIGVDIK
jgi:hypothetical protein